MLLSMLTAAFIRALGCGLGVWVMNIIFSVSIIIASALTILSPANIKGQNSFSRPTLITALCEHEPTWHVKVYEDKDYQFVYRHYGNAEYVPGFFVYSKSNNKWLEITKLSTENAKLGHSPPFEEVRLSVGWDYSSLNGSDYVELPLHTSGSISFPNEIVDEASSEAYHLNFDPSLKPEYQTWFWILKKDLERVFRG
jgi:hypothetical protein